jgi:acyl carrier protein
MWFMWYSRLTVKKQIRVRTRRKFQADSDSAVKGPSQMIDTIREFIFSALREMNYDTDGIEDDTQLGPRGADLASLSLAELAVRVEDQFGVTFSEEEAEELAGKTVGEFCVIVAERMPKAEVN